MMKRGSLILLVAAGALVVLPAVAITPGPRRDYNKITERNVFGLREPAPAPQANAPAQEAPLPKLILTGITTILGNKIAFLKAQFPAEKGAAAKEESMMLSEGQREGPFEVLEIDEHAEQVKVNNSGKVMPLTFDKDSLKTPPPAGSPAPGAQPARAQFHPSRLFSRNLRLPTTTAPLPTVAAPPPPQANPPVQGPNEARTSSPLTPEEQTILQKLEAAAAATNQSVPAPLPRPAGVMPALPQ
ncbi:MAG TPA: hypothetical protein VHH88_02935 [Verrucomicrobiae bacterium]|nr:hypothetical protein [Verrucomicrobiae bacterium]